MPRYKYECEYCKHVVELLRKMAERDELPICPECIGEFKMPRVFEAPFMQIGKPANTNEDRDDKFWDNAEKLRLKREKKRQAEEKERLRFGDKQTIAKEEAKIKNYEQTGNKESADNVAKKIESIKK